VSPNGSKGSFGLNISDWRCLAGFVVTNDDDDEAMAVRKEACVDLRDSA
jgi:hypothetical protein